MRLQDSTQGKMLHQTDAEHGTSSDASLENYSRYRFGLAYGRLIYRFRWFIIVLWVAGVIVSVPFAGKLTSVLSGGGFSFSGSESVHVANIITDKLHQPFSQLFVVFQSPGTQVSDPAYQQEANDFANRARTFPHVTGVTTGGAGRDGRTTFVTVNFNTQSEAVEQQLPDFRKLLPGTNGNPAGPARTYLTGNPAIYNDFTVITQQDMEQAEAIALPIALLVLLIVFGTVVAAPMPILLALVAVPVSLAVLYAIALHNQTSVFVLNVASGVGLGLSIDYSLFMTRRFRDELALGRSVREAVAWTVAMAGEAILFSGLTVVIGFMGLLLLGIQFMTSFGVGGAVVVGSSLLAALTLLPALLGVLGSHINSLRIPFLSRFTAPRKQNANNAQERQGFWHAWAMTVMRRPVTIVLLVSALLIGLGWPIFSINLGIPTSSALPKSSESRQGIDILNAQFPEANENPVYIIAQTLAGSSILTSDNIIRIDHLTKWIASQKHVTNVVSLTQLPSTPGAPALTEQQLEQLYSTGAYKQNPAIAQFVSSTTAGDTTMIVVKSDAKTDSAEGKALIDTLRAGDVVAGQGLRVLVGGFQAISLDFSRYLYGNFPKAILFILVATYILLLLMFRSILLPLKAVLMNILSVSVTYGVLVFIFQWGNFSNLLNFTPDGFIDSTIPILLFCILFGLSMDYEVFLLSRIREEWLRTQDNRWAVAHGLEKTGGVITNAALLFVIVAGALVFTSIIITKETGLGMAVAVLVDATIIRSLLVPATMRLLGRWNWWLPGRPLPPKQVE
jgi:RND superfamily putative drug exporter